MDTTAAEPLDGPARVETAPRAYAAHAAPLDLEKVRVRMTVGDLLKQRHAVVYDVGPARVTHADAPEQWRVGWLGRLWEDGANQKFSAIPILSKHRR